MATPAVRDPSAQEKILELETLQLLPCGCVTAVRRVRSWDLLVVSLEAKGPHCRLAPHQLGRVVFGDRRELTADDEEDELLAG